MIAFAESIENPEDHDSIQIILENTIGLEDQRSTPDQYKEKYNKTYASVDEEVKAREFRKFSESQKVRKYYRKVSKVYS